jgi:hypothetical protein
MDTVDFAEEEGRKDHLEDFRVTSQEPVRAGKLFQIYVTLNNEIETLTWKIRLSGDLTIHSPIEPADEMYMSGDVKPPLRSSRSVERFGQGNLHPKTASETCLKDPR